MISFGTIFLGCFVSAVGFAQTATSTTHMQLTPDQALINGVWKGKQTTSLTKIKSNPQVAVRTITINYPNYIHTIERFMLKNERESIEERKQEGKIVGFRKSTSNDSVYELDVELTRATILLKQQHLIESYGAQACAKLNVPLDAMSNGCGELQKYKNTKKIFDIVMLVNKDTMLRSVKTGTADKANKRPFEVALEPLKRVL